MTWNANKLRLKWKIFIFLLGFCALLLLVLWLFQTVLLDFFYQKIKVMEMKSNIRMIEKNIDNPNLSDLLEGISQNSDVCIEILSFEGIAFYSEDVLRDCVIHKLSCLDKVRLIAEAWEQGGEFFETVSRQLPPKPNRNEDYEGRLPALYDQPMQSLVYIRLIRQTDSEMAAIVMNSVVSPVSATVTTLRYQLYIVTALMLVLAVVLAFIIAKRVAGPIEAINKSAKVLAVGKYDIRFNGKGYLEIGELSDTLNTAAVELSKVEGFRRELLANISHDLRTPLSLIYSYAEMMHDFPDEITPEQTRVIMDETRRLATLVNDVLDISKLETGTETLNLSVFTITKSIRHTTERVAELVKKDGYQMVFAYDCDVMVSADEVKIIQAYYNLLLNAIHYTGQDKTVTVRQTVSDGIVRIEVTDTGGGIDEKNLPYIWDRYYKVDKTHKRAVTGLGLGLSIVKKILELHGGGYGVQSCPGQGSTFWFELRTKDLDFPS